jgi:hypothetical protein
MNVRLTALAAALIACSTSVWAATSNVDVYGTMLPTHEIYSAAADSGTNFFSFDPTYTQLPYTQLLDITATPGSTAQISGSGYTASASTSLGSNHAYASASTMPTNVRPGHH